MLTWTSHAFNLKDRSAYDRLDDPFYSNCYLVVPIKAFFNVYFFLLPI